VVFIYKNKWKELIKPHFWLGLVLSLVIISPLIYWNIQNNFISFKYQAGHVLTWDSSVFKNLGSSFLVQMLSWGVFPFVFAIYLHYLLIKNFKTWAKNFYIEIFFSSVCLLFFIYVSLTQVLLPHWMLIYFLLSIPLAFATLLNNLKYKNKLILGGLFSSLLSLTLLAELGFSALPIRFTQSAYEGIAGWQNIISTANNKLISVDNPKKAIAVMNWTLGSRAMYYNYENSKVFVIDSRFDQFDIWNPESPIGYDLILAIEANKKDENLAHVDCAEINAIGEYKTYIKDVPVNHFLYYHCKQFKNYKN
jgi:hypothetical protein